jgi:hypothetical protein
VGGNGNPERVAGNPVQWWYGVIRSLLGGRGWRVYWMTLS